MTTPATLTAPTIDKAREEFTQACQQLARAQARLDIDRRALKSQHRQAAQAFPFASQVAERDAYVQQCLENVRLSILLVDEAKELRIEKYNALTDPTEEDGWC